MQDLARILLSGMGNGEETLGPGDEFDAYEIEAVIGRGGMGVVYRARHRPTNRLVALKVIASHWAHNKEFRERFERERSLALKIEHPNVIPVYDVGEGEEDGRPFIAMRFVEGRDLNALRNERGRFPACDAVALLTQIADALDAAHAHGVVHRDVKPANVLVDGAEHLYLTDFGIAKLIQGPRGLTATGRFVGTPGYISPEQIKGQRVDARSDIYSLGCVLYALLVGTAPFAEREFAARYFAHATGEAPPPPSSGVPDLPAELDVVIARAMANDPDERYPSAGDLARAAVAAASGQPNTEPERSVARGDAAPTEPPRRRLVARTSWRRVVRSGGFSLLRGPGNPDA